MTTKAEIRKAKAARIIREILEPSCYMPESGVYRIAQQALEKMSNRGLDALHTVVVLGKRQP